MNKGPRTKPDVATIFTTKTGPTIQEDAVVIARMQEWHQVLEADFSPLTPLHAKMQEIAILGATARVFEALLYSPQKLGKKIFPFAFLDGVRSTIYHAANPFSQLNDKQQRKFSVFFSHLYEICREKLATVTGKSSLPSLKTPLNKLERDEAYFKEALNYAMVEGGTYRKKIKKVLRDRLNENLMLLNDIVILLRANPGFLVTGDSPMFLERANVARASVMGTLMAWISLDTTSMLGGEFYLREEDTRKSTLSKDSVRLIEKTYKEYITPGKNYRHKNSALAELVSAHHITAMLASHLATNIDAAIQQGAASEAMEQYAKWEQHPVTQQNEEQKERFVSKWLIAAAEQGSLALVQFFKQRCQRNSGCAFALVNAAKAGRREMVEWLIASKMPISCDLLDYAIDLATENSQFAMAQFLEFKVAELFPAPAGSSSSDDDQLEMGELTRQLEGLLASSAEELELDESASAVIFSTPHTGVEPVPNSRNAPKVGRALLKK